jgi:hypothetical protein
MVMVIVMVMVIEIVEEVDRRRKGYIFD